LVVLLLVAAALCAPACPYVQCQKTVNDNCWDDSALPYKVFDCPAGKFCNFGTKKCMDIPTPPTPSNVLPGMKADKDEYCLNLKRDNGYCIGLVEGADCKMMECGANLYCKAGKCAPVLADGADCAASNECKLGSGCQDKKCVAKFSQAVGTTVTEEYMCKSAHWLAGKCVETKAAPAPEWFDNTVDFTTACKYDGERTETGVCVGHSEDAKAAGMCNEYAGSYLKTVTDIPKYWASAVNNCPPLNPFCDLGLDKVDGCTARAALESPLYNAKKISTKRASCIPSTMDKRFEKYKCFSSSLVMGLLTFLAIIFLL
jgi:hypothetical protein